eukprot:1509140-Prymnesium_polylepis.1
MPILLAGLHYHAPPAPSTTARACLNALTANGEVRVGFARRWCVVPWSAGATRRHVSGPRGTSPQS